MININNDTAKKDCCGCRACEQICPVKSISIESDKEGFQYPEVDLKKCIDCGKCEKICPIRNKGDYYDVNAKDEPIAYGGWIKDEKTRYESSSGGVFSAFANYILQNNGIVYGAVQDSDLSVKHIGIEKKEDLYRFRKSKYVQSDTQHSYTDIKKHLEKGRMVLFVGTPCQVAGLHYFLQKPYKNLYLIDFICHGVPSPKVFKSYIDFIEKKNNSKVSLFRFRTKDKGWNPLTQTGTYIEMDNGNIIRNYPAFRDEYMAGFLDDIYLRPSCYNCAFKSLPKYYSDITIADFWGIDRLDKELYDGKGTSLLLINSEHGTELLNEVKDDVFLKKCDFKEAIKRNPSLIKSVEWNTRRDNFFKDFANKKFDYVARKYMNPFIWCMHKVVKIIWGIVTRIIKTILSPILKLLKINWTDKNWDDFMQFVKFSMVGVTNVLVSYGINVLTLLLLKNMNIRYDYVIANTVAFVLSVLWSFCLNNKFVFKLSQNEERSTIKTLIKTYISYGFTGLILNNLLATFWIKVLGISKYISPLLNLPISIPINFLMNKLWAYKKNTGSEGECK